jgi:hypothetical protein
VLVQAQEFRNMTMGSRPWREETGTFQVGIFHRAGAGFALADTLARQVRDSFMDWKTPDNALRVETIDGPLDLDPAADDGWHRLGLEMQYQFWTQAEGEDDGIEEAPSDGFAYVRRDGAWTRMPPDINALEYTFNAQLVEPPGDGQIRFNNADPTLATIVWVSNTTATGIDVSSMVTAVVPQITALHIADKDTSMPWVRFVLSAPPIAKGNGEYTELNVTYHSGAGGPLNAQRVIMNVIRQ